MVAVNESIQWLHAEDTEQVGKYKNDFSFWHSNCRDATSIIVLTYSQPIYLLKKEVLDPSSPVNYS